MIIDKNIKHYYQQGLNCGPTSLRMIATGKYKWKRNKFFDEVCNLGNSGTTIYNLQEGAMMLGYKTILYQNAEIETLKKYLSNGYSIIVLYSSFGGLIGHYSTIRQITKTHIQLYDPIGGIRKITIPSFFEIWNTKHKDGKKNFLAIKE